MGCQPDLLSGYQDLRDPDVQARFHAIWGRPVPAAPGLTIPRLYDAMRDGRIAGLFVLGEDVAQSDPARHAAAGLDALELLVVEELFLSETARRAHVVLPGASFLEKDGTFTSGERRIQRVRQAVPVVDGARADWQILCALMARTGLPQPFTHPSQIFDEIARVAPLFAGVSYARLEGDGLQWPVPDADHPGTAILHTGGFARGRALLACVDHEPSPALQKVDREAYPLLLTTGRVLEHYNCGSMTRRSGSARLHPHDQLELAGEDARELGIGDGAAVVVRSPWGEAHAVARVAARIAPGTAFLSFHFPETGTNQLLSPVLDRLADCPEYKLVPVQVARR
jgi:predicted molibdopterin-dependent oxidoreductase YjgC